MKSVIVVFFLGVVHLGIAQSEVIRKANYNINSKNISIDGFDPVSYFKGEPLKGNENIRYTYKGVTYWFSSDLNRKEFEKNPIQYEPQYGGWCAYALGIKPDKVKIDPKTYKIIDGKLYLFYNFHQMNTLDLWNKDELTLKNIADQNWNSILH